jgi:hypothetical protein
VGAWFGPDVFFKFSELSVDGSPVIDASYSTRVNSTIVTKCLASAFAHRLNNSGKNPLITLLNRISPVPSESKSHISLDIWMNKTYFADSLRNTGIVCGEKKPERTFFPRIKIFLTVALMLPINTIFCPL